MEQPESEPGHVGGPGDQAIPLEEAELDAFLGPGSAQVRKFHGLLADQGVEVLHVIPSPFPKVWHTMQDDGKHLDKQTVGDWARIVAGFALEWLDMMEVWDGDETGKDAGGALRG